VKNVMRAVKITENVYWVGAIDWNIRDFHGYATRRGSTYNAYLVLAEKPAQRKRI
jgi:flavorubredoxin